MCPLEGSVDFIDFDHDFHLSAEWSWRSVAQLGHCVFSTLENVYSSFLDSKALGD